MTGADEWRPFLLVRVQGGRADFARWRIASGHDGNGQDALALFMTETGASQYAQRCLTGPGWCVVRPPRTAILEVLAACRAAGIPFAVLDPQGETARRVVSIDEILQAAALLGESVANAALPPGPTASGDSTA